jgi:hygromycin-B 4-O-kinase
VVESKASYSTELVAEFLLSRFGKGVGNIQPLKGGEWSSAYAFQCEGRDLVIRFGGDDYTFKKDQLAVAFASADLPIPKIKAIGEAFGGYFAISERALGELLESLSKEKMRRVFPALFRMLDAAREVDVSAYGFGDWFGPETASGKTWRDCLLEIANDPPDAYCHGWRAALAASPVGESAFDEAFERLKQLANEPPEGPHLVHNDLLCGNILVSEDRITGVIDWQCSFCGDLLYDIALLAYGAPWFPAMEGIDWEAEARDHFATVGLEIPELEERLLCCQIHVGLGAQQFNAHMRRWEEVEQHAKRTLELARRVENPQRAR